MKTFLDFVNTVYPLPEDILMKLVKLCKVTKYAEGDYLCEFHKVNDKIFFVNDGVVRTYMKSKGNTDINKSISVVGNIATSLESAIRRIPSDIACQALTDVEVIEASYTDFRKLQSESLEFSNFMFRVLELEYLRLEQQTASLLSKDATERYLELREKIPSIDNLIPQFQIASHLGITPIQLSRIRKKLSTES